MGLEKMRIELEREGINAEIIIINDARANNTVDRYKLVERTRLPIFQDSGYKNVWDLHAVGKDDMLIYDGTGKLVSLLPHGVDADDNGEADTDLSTDAGYQKVKAALIAATQAGG